MNVVLEDVINGCMKPEESSSNRENFLVLALCLQLEQPHHMYTQFMRYLKPEVCTKRDAKVLMHRLEAMDEKVVGLMGKAHAYEAS